MKKCAICFFGLMRNYNVQYTSLQQIFKKNPDYEFDLFIVTSSQNIVGLSDSNKHNTNVVSDEIFIDKLKTLYGDKLKKISVVENNDNMLEEQNALIGECIDRIKKNISDGYKIVSGRRITTIDHTKTQLYQSYKILKVIQIKNQHEIENNFTYDINILTRPDIYFPYIDQSFQRFDDRIINILYNLNKIDTTKLYSVSNFICIANSNIMNDVKNLIFKFPYNYKKHPSQLNDYYVEGVSNDEKLILDQEFQTACHYFYVIKKWNIIECLNKCDKDDEKNIYPTTDFGINTDFSFLFMRETYMNDNKEILAGSIVHIPDIDFTGEVIRFNTVFPINLKIVELRDCKTGTGILNFALYGDKHIISETPTHVTNYDFNIEHCKIVNNLKQILGRNPLENEIINEICIKKNITEQQYISLRDTRGKYNVDISNFSENQIEYKIKNIGLLKNGITNNTKLISYRGNIFEINKELENDPVYINNAIKNGYDVMIDVWFLDNNDPVFTKIISDGKKNFIFLKPELLNNVVLKINAKYCDFIKKCMDNQHDIKIGNSLYRILEYFNDPFNNLINIHNIWIILRDVDGQKNYDNYNNFITLNETINFETVDAHIITQLQNSVKFWIKDENSDKRNKNFHSGQWYTGSDFPKYAISEEFLSNTKLILHAKNMQALRNLSTFSKTSKTWWDTFYDISAMKNEDFINSVNITLDEQYDGQDGSTKIIKTVKQNKLLPHHITMKTNCPLSAHYFYGNYENDYNDYIVTSYGNIITPPLSAICKNSIIMFPENGIGSCNNFDNDYIKLNYFDIWPNIVHDSLVYGICSNFIQKYKGQAH